VVVERDRDAFDTFIAGSPSIWWGKKSILREVAAFKASQDKTRVPKRLLITVGELEAIGSPEEIRLGAAMKVEADKLMRIPCSRRALHATGLVRMTSSTRYDSLKQR
jgi:predicted alpha/beta superfamily hydrolase